MMWIPCQVKQSLYWNRAMMYNKQVCLWLSSAGMCCRINTGAVTCMTDRYITIPYSTRPVHNCYATPPSCITIMSSLPHGFGLPTLAIITAVGTAHKRINKKLQDCLFFSVCFTIQHRCFIEMEKLWWQYSYIFSIQILKHGTGISMA